MYRRHEEIPVYRQYLTSVAAQHYNRVLLALKRLSGELRLPLPGLRTLDLILRKDAWVVVDRALGDLPVIAWSDFESAGRSALHLPIGCRVRLFHAHAERIVAQAMGGMEALLDERLKPDSSIGREPEN